MDREKIVKGLERHRIDNNNRINCADCPYYVEDDNHIRCVNDLHDDTIALLKWQEAVEPCKDITRNRRCPNCYAILKGKFCHECGQAVKWE